MDPASHPASTPQVEQSMRRGDDDEKIAHYDHMSVQAQKGRPAKSSRGRPRGCRGRYLLTVRGENCLSSLARSSLAIRPSLHDGFALAIRRRRTEVENLRCLEAVIGERQVGSSFSVAGRSQTGVGKFMKSSSRFPRQSGVIRNRSRPSPVGGYIEMIVTKRPLACVDLLLRVSGWLRC